MTDHDARDRKTPWVVAMMATVALTLGLWASMGPPPQVSLVGHLGERPTGGVGAPVTVQRLLYDIHAVTNTAVYGRGSARDALRSSCEHAKTAVAVATDPGSDLSGRILTDLGALARVSCQPNDSRTLQARARSVHDLSQASFRRMSP